MSHLLAVDIDVTALCRRVDQARTAFGEREGEEATVLLMVVQAAVRALRNNPEILHAERSGPVRLVVGGRDGWVPIPDAGTLSLAGLARALGSAASGSSAPDGEGLAVVDAGSEDIDLELHPLDSGRRAALTVGAVRREVRVIDGPHGEVMGVRRRLRLGLTLDTAQVARAVGIDFLRAVRAIAGDADAGLDLAR